MEQPQILRPDPVAEEKLHQKIDEQSFDKNFKPRGAIAFFILLVILGLIIWYGIYFLMLERV